MTRIVLTAVLVLGSGALAVSACLGCGPKVFPKCGEPGVNCPPCTGLETYPDPCAMKKRDAGADADAEAGK